MMKCSYIRAAVTLSVLFLAVDVAPAAVTTVYYSFTSDYLLSQYDAQQSAPNMSSNQIGMLDLYARPDDPDVLDAYDFADIPAPTFMGASTPPWRSVTGAPASLGGTWRHFADLVELPTNTFVYLTSYTGNIYEFDFGPPEIETLALQYPNSNRTVFRVGLQVDSEVARSLAGKPLTWVFRAYGDTIEEAEPGKAYASGSKSQYFLQFNAESIGAVPEPGTFFVALTALAAIVAYKTRLARS
jgi:hypothetical protein